tara:strand:+ start:438 stop:1061 length:624 start_codon:yes stop_codon:yes gene_type:complete
MLLTEYIPFKVNKQLVEQSIKEKKPLVVSGIIQRAEAENQNKRVYPKETLLREIKNYVNGPIKERRALGELDHPESSVINLQNVSHNITEIKVKGNDIYGTFEILDTPAGRILKELFANNITVGVSSRGMGSVEENLNEEGDPTVTVQDDFELLCWDFVSTPSTQGAFVSPINSLQENKIKIPKYKYTKVNNIIRDIICENTGMCKC